MSTVTETEQTIEQKTETTPAGEASAAEKAEAQALLDKMTGAGQEEGGGQSITDETPPEETTEEETTMEAEELTPRLQKALDSVKGSDATKKALGDDPEALERIAKQRESASRAYGKLGAFTRKSKKAQAVEETPAPVTTSTPVVEPVVEETEFDDDAFYSDDSKKAFTTMKNNNIELRKMLDLLTERVDARDKGEKEQQETHRLTVFEGFLGDLDSKVYPQYGDGVIAGDGPAHEVQEELWNEYFDILEDAEARDKPLSETDALDQAFFHIHKEKPAGRPAKPKAKRPTGSVRPSGNPPVRTPSQAVMEDSRKLLDNFGKGKPLK